MEVLRDRIVYSTRRLLEILILLSNRIIYIFIFLHFDRQNPAYCILGCAMVSSAHAINTMKKLRLTGTRTLGL